MTKVILYNSDFKNTCNKDKLPLTKVKKVPHGYLYPCFFYLQVIVQLLTPALSECLQVS